MVSSLATHAAYGVYIPYIKSQPPDPKIYQKFTTMSLRPLRDMSQPHTSPYPKPIPPEKLDKAVRLYRRYKLKEGLDRLGSTPETAHSTASRTSISNAPSVSTSAGDRGTDVSSVMSFPVKGSPSSSTSNAKGELITYDGKKCKVRRRRPFNDKDRAKAALIRELGSCSVCRKSKTPVSFHHPFVLVVKI
jgi:hypothetical protein